MEAEQKRDQSIDAVIARIKNYAIVNGISGERLEAIVNVGIAAVGILRAAENSPDAVA